MRLREPIDQYVIDVVKKLRHTYQLDIQQLAAILGTRSSFVMDVESSNSREKYDIHHITLLSAYFDISPKYFLPQDPLCNLMEEIN